MLFTQSTAFPLGPDRAQRFLVGGPTILERDKARRAAEARMAKAWALWEACASEESWARVAKSSEA